MPTSAISFELTNFSEMAALLRDLPPSVESRVMGDTVAVALKPMRAAARAKAPKDTGALRRSISIKVKRYANQGKVVGLVGPAKGRFKGGKAVKRGGDFAGSAQPAKYAHLIEYGHAVVADQSGRVAFGRAKGQSLDPKRVRNGRTQAPAAIWVPARPFMRPAAASAKGAVLAGMEKGLAKGIERETKRLASKMRRLAKGN